MSLSDRLAHDTITAAHRDWIASLPLVARVAADAIAFHGTPDDDLEYLLATVTVTEAGARPATESEVLARVGDHPGEQLMLCGHSHLQRDLRLSTGALVLNPGSVGYPAYDDDTPYPHVMEAGTRVSPSRNIR
jgi:diadenosine tetraphosphatase ApaH/serine/threonine PP2A family protein phosphatase